jgi:hypothetical protein
MTAPAAPAVPAVAPPAPRAVARPAIPSPRRAYFPLLALLAGLTVSEVANHGSWGAALLGAIGPDLALLLGVGAGLAPGQLHPRAVPAYNALHRFWGPAVLVVASALGVIGLAWLVGGLAWATHVALDRSVGYGLRTRAGFQRG